MENTAHVVTLLFILLLTIARGDPRSHILELICEGNTTNVPISNLFAIWDNISSQIRTSGFGTAEGGSEPYRIYGLFQCYGDLSLVDCVLCYTEARTVLPKCFLSGGVRIYLDGCFMRSEDYKFYEEYVDPGDKAICGNKTRKNTNFEPLMRRALQDATNEAPKNGGFGRASVSATGGLSESAHVLANRWRSLDSNSCQACLKNASSSVMECLPWSEGRALNTGCFLRYSDTDFLNSDKSSRHSDGVMVATIVAVISAGVILGAALMIGLFILKRKRLQKKRKGSNDATKFSPTLYSSSLNFKYSTLEKATGSFSTVNKLGQGGFGAVYKGVLADGREVAVKRLFFNNRHRASDFFNEVNIIGSVEHKNLVRLLGCSCLGAESLLVYELLPNQSLDRFLFDPERAKVLDWKKRFNIIIGMAEGLAYLHENSTVRIIHRDIKASNILLDSKFRAKISDFGLARSFQEDKSHISTAVAGTLGYMAPEYIAHGQLTEKADVFSFGVVLLEIVTGMANGSIEASNYEDKFRDSSISLLTYVWNHFQMGTVDELVDLNVILYDSGNADVVREEIARVVHVGLLCTQEIPLLRPSMSCVLRMLLNKEEELLLPTKPPFTNESTMELNITTEDQERHLNPPYSANISYSSIYAR